MTVHNLQNYLEANISGSCVPVDLLRIAQSVGSSRGTDYGYRGRSAPLRRPHADQWSGRRRLGSGCGRRGGNTESSRGAREAFGLAGPPHAEIHSIRSRLLPGRGRPGRSRFMSWEARDWMGRGSGWGRGRGNQPHHFDDKFHPSECDSFYPPASPHMPQYTPSIDTHQYYQGPHAPWSHNQPLYNRFSQAPRESQGDREYYSQEYISDMDNYVPTYHQTESEYWSGAPGYFSEDYEDSSISHHHYGPGGQYSDDQSQPWYSDISQPDQPRRRSLSDAGTLSYTGSQRPKSEALSEQPFSLVLDAEGCMDRLYGGFYSG